ncbi:hypothetical protein C8R43DRAFT_1005250 [Mycena crocata]|nr:hypothetical protein C8R43DRAFT_1005250 [Mycena crocata]
MKIVWDALPFSPLASLLTSTISRFPSNVVHCPWRRCWGCQNSTFRFPTAGVRLYPQQSSYSPHHFFVSRTYTRCSAPALCYGLHIPTAPICLSYLYPHLIANVKFQ